MLYVPRNVEIDQPLYSLIGLSEPHAADFSHTLVILEDGASATLLEETSSANPDAAGLHVGAVELIVGKGAAHFNVFSVITIRFKDQHVGAGFDSCGSVLSPLSHSKGLASTPSPSPHLPPPRPTPTIPPCCSTRSPSSAWG